MALKANVFRAMASLTTVAAVSVISITNAHSDPQGGRVTHGIGNIDKQNLTTTINQSSQSLALDWDTFNINSNERVHFIQPDSSSIALNNILDHNGSQIHGRLDANGHVILNG